VCIDSSLTSATVRRGPDGTRPSANQGSASSTITLRDIREGRNVGTVTERETVTEQGQCAGSVETDVR